MSASAKAESGGREPVGLVGLGIMGTAYANLLIAAGHVVYGHDVSPANLERFAAGGGRPLEMAAAVAAAAPTVLTALPSDDALLDACFGDHGLLVGVRPGSTVVELSTLSIATKERCRSGLATAGAILLDCPVSGTGAQAARGDIDILASGEAGDIDRLRPLFSAFARQVHHVGGFGSGMKLKLIANLLVTIHNVAAAEALLLARLAGLDLRQVYETLRTGAGTSRMLEVRGPLMIEDRYRPATARMAVHRKDIDLIAAFADEVHCPTPLFAASQPFYAAALAQGRGEDDTAAVFAILRGMTEAA